MTEEERKELGRKFEEEMKKIGITIQDIPNGINNAKTENQEIWIIKDNGKR